MSGEPVLVAERIRVRVLSAPLEDSVPMSFGRLEKRQVCLVEIEAGGLTGLGESWVNYPAWGPVERVATLTEGAAPRLVGTDVSDPVAVQGRLARELLPIGRQWGALGPIWQTISAVDIALWDLRGQALGEPIHRLLAPGGGRSAVAAYASGVGPNSVEDLSRSAVTDGYTALKVKLGFDRATDEATLHDARTIVGLDIALFADANQAWDLATATSMCDLLRSHDVSWLEEPIAGDSLEELEKLHAATGMTLATGENLYGLATFQQYIDSSAVQVIQPDLAKSGGLTMARRVAEHASADGTTVAPHCYSSGVGVAAMLQLAGAYDAVGWLEYDVRPNPLRDNLFTEPMRLEGGRLAVPSGPGLGVRLSPEAIARFQTHAEERTHHDL